MSRWDDEGFWWEDEERVSRGQRIRPTPAIPPSNWLPPKDFPNLSGVKIIGVDTETFDPNLLTHGPGWARGDGHLVGVSISAGPADSWYFPLRHELQKEMNMEIEPVIAYLKDILGVDRPAVGANVLYDVGWLGTEGIKIKGTLYDVQYAEALLDEVAVSYSLDTIAKKYLGKGKFSEELYKWCALAFGGNATKRQAGNIYRAPITLVGPYAESDAHEPLAILNKQWGDLHQLGLLDLFKMECRLIPVLYGMQLRGMTVDLERTEKARIQLQDMEVTAQEELNAYAGFEVGVDVTDDLQELCDQKGISYPSTRKGNPSFVQKWLENHESKGLQLVTEVRKLQKNRVTFIENGILEKQVGGVVHPSYHPLRGERGGAVSGRFSSSKPNATQIPSRHPVFAPLIRGLYIPEKFYTDWMKFDLSQIEYRLFAHDSGDQDLIAAYQDPNADFHKVVGAFLGDKLPRKVIKGFNFGKLYGMQKAKTTQGMKDNLTIAEIEELFLLAELTGDNQAGALADYFINLYDTQFPSAEKTLQKYSTMAKASGEIRTILNRRSTFQLWGPVGYGNKDAGLPYEEAILEYGYKIERAHTHKALNRRLQGGAADLMKKGMLEAYDMGLFAPDKMGFPHVIVHDEWGFSYHKDLKEDFKDFKQCLENTFELKVPIILDTDIGPDWGHVKRITL